MKNIYFKRKQEILIIFLLIPLTIFMQMFVIEKLPLKYFYDSDNILSMVKDMSLVRNYDSSYVFTAKFFSMINIFKLTTFEEWAYLISFITILYTVFKIKEYDKLTIDKLIFMYCTIILANIYIYRISKDIIQWIFFLLIYIVGMKKNMKLITKIICISCILALEGIYFRFYYFLILIFFLFIMYLFMNIKNINMKKVIIIFMVCLTIGLLILQKINPEKYFTLINIREYVNGGRQDSADAITIINDFIKTNNNVVLYILNYCINLFRFLFPIELFRFGIKYMIFAIYQIYISINLIIKIANIKKERGIHRIILLAIMVSYLLVANIYEPDFGSFIRHETALYLIMFELFFGEEESMRETSRKDNFDNNINI